jgi:hypothetical protein
VKGFIAAATLRIPYPEGIVANLLLDDYARSVGRRGFGVTAFSVEDALRLVGATGHR